MTCNHMIETSHSEGKINIKFKGGDDFYRWAMNRILIDCKKMNGGTISVQVEGNGSKAISMQEAMIGLFEEDTYQSDLLYQDNLSEFIIANTKFTSLLGVNFSIQHLQLNTNPELSSLEGLRQTEVIHLRATNKIEHLKDNHKILPKNLLKIHFDHSSLKSHILSVLLLPEFKKMTYVYNPNLFWDKNFDAAIEVVNQHLIEARDLLDCQEELITLGLKEYAKL